MNVRRKRKKSAKNNAATFILLLHPLPLAHPFILHSSASRPNLKINPFST
jgi:hypothetical protein